MKTIRISTAKVDGKVLLEIHVPSIEKLLEEGGVRQLVYRGLTAAAEETIAGYMDGYSVKTSMEPIILVSKRRAHTALRNRLPVAIHRHFAERIPDLDHEIRLARREGTESLLIAIVNAIVAVLFFATFSPLTSDNQVVVLVGGLSTVLNWVTVWHTFEFFVHDWQNLPRQRKIYEKGASIPVRIIEEEAS